MPQDPSTDPDFLKASPSDQMAYLRDTDPDFAAASPQDQLGYLFHLRGLNPTIAGPAKPNINMQTSALGYLNPQPISQGGPRVPTSGQVPGSFEGSYSSGDTDYGKFMTGAGLATGAALGTPTVVGAAAKAATPAVVAAGNWAEANPMLAKLLLEAAKATGYGAAVYKGLKRVTK